MAGQINTYCPLVSVTVIAYKSAATIVDTLESVLAQTYSNIELIVSDDCSPDATVHIAETWIAQHKDRFVRAVVIKAEHNTGQSCNYNRAFDACQGEWIKEIDGDDLLTPTCIEDFVCYSKEHPSAVYVFGKIKAFGGSDDLCANVEQVFDYSFFTKTLEDQLHYLIFERNCIPSPASFYNRQVMLKIGFRCDERIPYLEDHPKWINLLKAGICFEFMDKVVALYRINTGVSIGIASPFYYETNRKFCFLYQLPEWLKIEGEKAFDRIREQETNIYKMYYSKEQEIAHIRRSKAYRIGKFITNFFKFAK